jgi:hypothetical protein
MSKEKILMREILLVDLQKPNQSEYVSKSVVEHYIKTDRLKSNRYRFFLMETKRLKCHISHPVVDAVLLDEINIETLDDVNDVWCSLIDGLPNGAVLQSE